jgi:pimeloyl-ACP methyl ester carboxylesterase
LYQEEELSAEATTICVDLAGFGESAGLGGPYTVARHATDVVALLTELDVRRARVVGFAYGAMVALELACQVPELLSDLIVIGVPSAATAPYERMPRSMKRDWPDFAARSARSICSTDVSEATLRWLTGMFAATPLPVALATVAELAEWEPLPLAESIAVPTLVVSGSEDTIVPVDVARALAARMPYASLELVSGSGHLVPIDGRVELSRLIRGQ